MANKKDVKDIITRAAERYSAGVAFREHACRPCRYCGNKQSAATLLFQNQGNAYAHILEKQFASLYEAFSI
jgi:hypothetical protein